jgi:hypothetical protein
MEIYQEIKKSTMLCPVVVWKCAINAFFTKRGGCERVYYKIKK